MSDPTYVDGWNLKDPMEVIRKQRTEIELIGSFNKYNKNGSIAVDELIAHAISELDKRYKYKPTEDYCSKALDVLLHMHDLSRGTSSSYFYRITVMPHLSHLVTFFHPIITHSLLCFS